MDEVWDPHWFGSTKTLDVHIAWLRKKLGDDPAHPRYITTIRGVGFRFATVAESRIGGHHDRSHQARDRFRVRVDHHDRGADDPARVDARPARSRGVRAGEHHPRDDDRAGRRRGEPSPGTDVRRSTRSCRTPASQVAGRVIVVDHTGALVADSLGPASGQPYATSGRPEIVAALADTPTSVIRASQDLGTDIMATAVPIVDERPGCAADGRRGRAHHAVDGGGQRERPPRDARRVWRSAPAACSRD